MTLSLADIQHRLQTKNMRFVDPNQQYTTIQARYTFQCCLCQHTWSGFLDNQIRGRGCQVCLKQRSFDTLKNKLYDHGMGLIDATSRQRCVVECLSCHRQRCGTSYHLCKTKCRKCFPGLKHSQAYVEADLRKKNMILLEKYHGSSHRHRVQCTTCQHIWSPYLSNVLHKPYACKPCYRASRRNKSYHRYTRQEIEHTLAKKKILLVDRKYTATNKRHIIRCQVCQYTWKPLLANLFYNLQGCPQCVLAASKHSLSVIQNRLAKKHMILKSKVYTRVKDIHKVQCQRCHHTWRQRLGQILYRTGTCQYCKNKQRPGSRI